MSPLEIEYRGYVIHYAENQDVWRCAALEVDAERLPTVKAKVDRIIAAARKLQQPVPVIRVDYNKNPVDVRVMALVQPKKNRDGTDKEPDAAWCMVPGRERYFDGKTMAYQYREIEVRARVSLEQLFIDSPANRERLKLAAATNAQIDHLTKERDALLDGMDRFGVVGVAIGDDADDRAISTAEDAP